MGDPACEIAWEARCNLGESPVWDGETQTLYLVVCFEPAMCMMDAMFCRVMHVGLGHCLTS